MAQARCNRGHIYDSEIYDKCPYCDHETETIEFGEDYSQDGVGKSVPVSVVEPDTLKKTTAPSDYIEKQDEIKRTRAAFSSKQGSEPVVGWLVGAKRSEKRKEKIKSIK